MQKHLVLLILQSQCNNTILKIDGKQEFLSRVWVNIAIDHGTTPCEGFAPFINTNSMNSNCNLILNHDSPLMYSQQNNHEFEIPNVL